MLFDGVCFCVTCSNLLRHADELINNRGHIRVFVPLCGKTVDMKW